MPAKNSNTKTGGSKTSNTEKNIEELRSFYNKFSKSIDKTYAAKEALKIASMTDAGASTRPLMTTFSKDKLRRYMQNPSRNEKELREVSRFLYYRSQQYRRLVWFNASMLMPDMKAIIPKYNPTKKNAESHMMKQFYRTAEAIEKVNLSAELLKMYVLAWREDVAYGCVFYDQDQGMFILPLNPDFCRISSAYITGDLGFDMDMSYFDRRESLIEAYGEPFESMYKEYAKNKQQNKWQPMPDKYCICLKCNIDDITISLPPYVAMFNSIIDLADLENIQAIKDEIGIYKILVAKMETLRNANEADDFSVNPTVAMNYFNRLVENLPDWCGAAISPLPIEAIDLHTDETSETNKISKATETLYNTSGGSQILNSGTVSGSTAWTGAAIADSEYAMSSLLPQTQQWFNRFVSCYVKDPAKIKFLEVTSFTKDAYKERLFKEAMYGLPVKLTLNILNGFSEMETLSLNYFEENVLHLSKLFVPLQASNSTNVAGQDDGDNHKKDDGTLTDEGEKTRDEDKNKQ